MRIKINLSKAARQIGKVISDNSDTIIKIGGIIFLAVAAKKFDIPITVSTDGSIDLAETKKKKKKDKTVTLEDIDRLLVKNPEEAAIMSFVSSAKGQSDYYRYEEARKILHLIKNKKKDLEPSTITFAINALNSISSEMSSSYYRREVSDLIPKLLEFA